MSENAPNKTTKKRPGRPPTKSADREPSTLRIDPVLQIAATHRFSEDTGSLQSWNAAATEAVRHYAARECLPIGALDTISDNDDRKMRKLLVYFTKEHKQMMARTVVEGILREIGEWE